ncbi:peptidoglycan DD-metalloendopeptidase family protein [Anaerobacillus sp. CMMVII]|nr:peptidoglycan DD-metalloendopeptidase family protein [Anaerobacillus sp. CMMVII]
MAVALSIGILFVSATVSFAESNANYEERNYIWPTVGVVTDTFGTRNGKHYGIDIAAPRGTTVVSVSDGIVTKSYNSSSYGNVIFIGHTDGYETVYAHLHKRFVEEGAVVKQGEEIGIVGNTGRSSGDHLHFEIHEGNWTMSKKYAVDPMQLLEGSDKQVASVSNSIYDEATIESGQTLYIKVKEGDSLWSIAKVHDVTIEQIQKWNNLSSDKIKIDQKLKIVPKGKYVVQSGDTLWKIAEQSGTTVSNIKRMNGLKGDNIQVGVLLTVDN